MPKDSDMTPSDMPMTARRSQSNRHSARRFMFTRQDLSVYRVVFATGGRLVEFAQVKEGTVPAYCYRCKKEHKGHCGS